MKAKLVSEIMENYFDTDVDKDELIVRDDQDVEELLSIINVSDHMLKPGINPILHTKDEYRKARKKAWRFLKRIHKMKDSEIEKALQENFGGINKIMEAFDVLTWSKKNLPEVIAREIEEAHEGGYGEKLQKSLLKIANKDELLKWYNQNFEVGQIQEMEHAANHPWNQVYKRIFENKRQGLIKEEKHLQKLISFIQEHGNYNLSPDDIEDAAWAAWTDTKN
jgi:hypothetical protein